MNEVSIRNVNDPMPIGQGDIGTIVMDIIVVVTKFDLIVTLRLFGEEQFVYVITKYGRTKLDESRGIPYEDYCFSVI